MNWDDVRIFLAVARQKQILGAARSLQLNHATVARRLTALEEGLGTRLFVRKTNGSDLSAEGEKFLGFAEAMESQILAAQEATGGWRGDQRHSAGWGAGRVWRSVSGAAVRRTD